MSTSAISLSSSVPPQPIPPSLHQVVADRDLSQLKAILQAPGTDKNMRNQWQWTPLHSAIAHNWPEGAEALIEAGADLEARCNEGMTPLHHAAFYSQLSTLNLLLQKWVNIEALDLQHRTPLLLAAQSLQPQLAEALIGAGANIHISDENNCSPLWHAIDLLNLATISVLIANGASHCDWVTGNTIFHLKHEHTCSNIGVQGLSEVLLRAMKPSSRHIAPGILETETPIVPMVNATNKAGETPLQQAIYFYEQIQSPPLKPLVLSFIHNLYLAGASLKVPYPPSQRERTAEDRLLELGIAF